MKFELDEEYKNNAKIKVIGVGGAGGNAVNRMVRSGFTGVEFIAINTDSMALSHNLADIKITIGEKLTSGLGAGAKPDVGYAAIQEDRDAVASVLTGADMVFITAGMGGGTGTGAAPVVAEIARELGILTVAVITKPFLFEGPIRARNCRQGVENLTKFVDTIIMIQNQKILSVVEKKTSWMDAFALADGVLTDAVRGISEIILKHGAINVDFADVKAVMENGGEALMGTGVAEGENRAVVAAERAIASPLLDDVSIKGAMGILVNISGGTDLGLDEVDRAMSYLYEAVGEENQTNIIFGIVPNNELEGKISVTVIATGFSGSVTPPREAVQPKVSEPKAVVTPVVEAQPLRKQNATPIAPKSNFARVHFEGDARQGYDVEEVELPVLPARESRDIVREPVAAARPSYQQDYDLGLNTRKSTSEKKITLDAYDEEDVDRDVPAFLRNQDY
jgi:cell division protein FtsZ